MENQKKCIVVTGASRGIGAAIAKKLAGEGITLVLMMSSDSGDTSNDCEALGSEVHRIVCDLSKPEEIKTAWEKIEKISGGSIHSLINNAGIWIEDKIDARPWSDYEVAMAVNLNAPMLLTSLAVPYMTDGCSIIFIASIASRKSYGGGTNYCAAKFGLLGFAGSLFEDVRERGIKVVTVLPGQVDTDMHADEPGIIPERMIAPEDVAEAVQWAMSMPSRVCPSEITLLPQRNPKPRK